LREMGKLCYNTDMLRLNSQKYLEWRKSVLLKADNQCVICGKLATHVHHIKHWASYPRLRYKINNGMALCKDHHGSVHFIAFNRYNPLNKNPFIIIVPGLAYRLNTNFNSSKILRKLEFFGNLWLY